MSTSTTSVLQTGTSRTSTRRRSDDPRCPRNGHRVRNQDFRRRSLSPPDTHPLQSPRGLYTSTPLTSRTPVLRQKTPNTRVILWNKIDESQTLHISWVALEGENSLQNVLRSVEGYNQRRVFPDPRKGTDLMSSGATLTHGDPQ